MKLKIDPSKKLGYIHPELQGQFSEHLGRCIYEGIYVGEDNKDIPNVNGMRKDVIEALKQIKIPVLRWPGGCFADEYHWKDGIGPKEGRKKMINTHWGGVVEDNSFGTHEYFELIRQLGCKSFVSGNVGSGTVQEMSEWVEYMTFDGVSPMAELRAKNGSKAPWRVDYFGVGNENYGCGGNMNPDYYGNLYRRYQTYVRTYDSSKPIFKIASGSDDPEWTNGVLETCFRAPESVHGFMDAISLHYYTIPGNWDEKGSATEFDEEEWYRTLAKALYIDNAIRRDEELLDKYDKNHQVGISVDEWGTWYTCEPGTNPGFLYQQNTIRDALVAGISLDIFNKHCNRVVMANIAQMVNVLQAMLLTDGDKMIKTPTYHVFDMYKHHQGAELLESSVESETVGVTDEFMVPSLHESVSLGQDGKVHITLNNLSADKDYEIEGTLENTVIKSVLGEIVSGAMHDHNTFDEPEKVTKKNFLGCAVSDNKLKFTIPRCSVLHLGVEIL